MNMLTAIAAVPAIGLPSAALALVTTDRSAWDAALSQYRRGTAAYALADHEYENACRAYDAQCLNRDDEFLAYGLKCPVLERENIVSIVRESLCVTAFGGSGMFIYPPEKRAEQAAKMPEIAANAERIADDYLAWREHNNEAYDRIIGPAEREHDKAVNKHTAVREALFLTAAPDAEAVLLKLDLLATVMAEALEDDADRVAIIRDDARRLLTNGRA